MRSNDRPVRNADRKCAQYSSAVISYTVFRKNLGALIYEEIIIYLYSAKIRVFTSESNGLPVFSKDEESSELWCNVPHEARILGKSLDHTLVSGVEKYWPILKNKNILKNKKAEPFLLTNHTFYSTFATRSRFRY
jgi:hypothetical protein